MNRPRFDQYPPSLSSHAPRPRRIQPTLSARILIFISKKQRRPRNHPVAGRDNTYTVLPYPYSTNCTSNYIPRLALAWLRVNVASSPPPRTHPKHHPGASRLSRKNPGTPRPATQVRPRDVDWSRAWCCGPGTQLGARVPKLVSGACLCAPRVRVADYPVARIRRNGGREGKKRGAREGGPALSVRESGRSHASRATLWLCFT